MWNGRLPENVHEQVTRLRREPSATGGEASVCLVLLAEAESILRGREEASMRRVLGKQDWERASLRRLPAKRLEFIAGRLLLREVLAAACGCEPEETQFDHGPFGKPYLTGHEEHTGLEFNLSHSGGYVGLALSHERPVGLDLEHHAMSDEKPYLEMARRFFHPEETIFLTACSPGVELRHQFYRIWTKKEAYAKAQGSGLQIGLHSFHVLPEKAGQNTEEPLIINKLHDEQRWLIKELPLGKAAHAAICMRADEGTEPPQTTFMDLRGSTVTKRGKLPPARFVDHNY